MAAGASLNRGQERETPASTGPRKPMTGAQALDAGTTGLQKIIEAGDKLVRLSLSLVCEFRPVNFVCSTGH